MAEIDGISVTDSNPPGPTGYQFENIENSVIEVGSVKNGMWVDVAREEIPKGAIHLGINARIRHRGIVRREGTAAVLPKPDSHEVVKSFTFVRENGDVYLIRIDASEIHVSTGGSWVLYTHPFVGYNRAYTNAQYLDRAFIANGTNRVMEINFGTTTVAEIANAPVAKFITSFADRIIAANIDTDKPYLIKWPTITNPSDWTGLGSGEEPLIQTDDDLSDAITGVFGFGQVLIILRNRSMWIGERQPSADKPFSFRQLFPGIGCDMPYAAVRAGNGIIFPNSQEKTVYYWEPGARPQPINMQVEEQIFKNLSDPLDARGAWDTQENEYHLGIPTLPGSGLLTETWVFARKYNAWTVDTSPAFTSLDAAAPSSGGEIAIDDLVGTIDGLGATAINSLKNSAGRIITTVMKGTIDGELVSLRKDLDGDYSGGTFNTEIVGPNIGGLSQRRTLKEFGIMACIGNGATLYLSWGKTPTTWQDQKIYNISVACEKPFKMRHKSLSGDNLYWRVVVNSTAQFEMLSWWARILPKGSLR